MPHKAYDWQVVPLSKNQLLDVRKEDILENGLYRICHTKRGGGGYDKFPMYAAYWLGGKPEDYDKQFVVQLRGCNLDCPYCYVTRAGVWGKPTFVGTSALVGAYMASQAPVFHLMGGAPALYLRKWPELVQELHKKCPQAIFHSDFMLTEVVYNLEVLSKISSLRCIYAINIKGLTADEWEKNTRKVPDWDLFWRNWNVLQNSGIFAYVTFTGIDSVGLDDFWDVAQSKGIMVGRWKRHSYIIDIIDYEAMSHVDNVPYGWNPEKEI